MPEISSHINCWCGETGVRRDDPQGRGNGAGVERGRADAAGAGGGARTTTGARGTSRRGTYVIIHTSFVAFSILHSVYADGLSGYGMATGVRRGDPSGLASASNEQVSPCPEQAWIHNVEKSDSPPTYVRAVAAAALFWPLLGPHHSPTSRFRGGLLIDPAKSVFSLKPIRPVPLQWSV